MRTALSDEQVASYRRDGFVAVADFLRGAELDEWQEVTEAAVRARLNRPGGPSNRAAPEYYRGVFSQVSGLRRLDKRMADLLLDPRIGRMAATLAGCDRVRVWNEQALFKPPFGNPTAYHIDLPYWSFTDGRALTLWIALDDATVESGCMWYLAGSHTAERDKLGDLMSGVGAILGDYPELIECTPVPVPVPAGGAVWHNARIAHGAGANMTGHPRRAMTCAYMPDGVTYNGHRDAFVLPAEVATALQVGDPLADERLNPLVPLA